MTPKLFLGPDALDHKMIDRCRDRAKSLQEVMLEIEGPELKHQAVMYNVAFDMEPATKEWLPSYVEAFLALDFDDLFDSLKTSWGYSGWCYQLDDVLDHGRFKVAALVAQDYGPALALEWLQRLDFLGALEIEVCELSGSDIELQDIDVDDLYDYEEEDDETVE